MRFPGWVVVALAAYSGVSAAPLTTPDTPATPPPKIVDVAAVAVDPHTHVLTIGSVNRRGEWTARRKIIAIGPTLNAGWSQVDLEGTESIEERRFTIHAPGRLPFALHDLVRVRFRQVQLGAMAFDTAFAVFDALDHMYAATFTDAAAIDGWTVGETSTKPCKLAITHGGKRVTIAPDGWYRLVTDDGVWAVSSDACRRPGPAPGQPPPNDWAPDPIVAHVSRLSRSR